MQVGAAPALPRIPAATLRRSRLLERLDADADRWLVLVSAPAGSGKSALLAQWAGQLEGPVAWVGCASSMSGPAFWSAVVMSIDRAWESAGILGAEVIDDAAQVVPHLDVARRLAASRTSGVIIVDDLHLAAVAPADLVEFIGALPPGIRLVLSTRTDPPFSLARLRTHGSLLELRHEDLHFDADETAAVVAAMDVDLAASEVARLHELSEGWPAGVHLLALALASSDAPVDSVLGDLSETDRNLSDYLLDEVIANLPDHLQRFLMVTAEVESFDVPLCEALLDDIDVGSVLDEVRSSNLFLVELGGQPPAYRYHHLFQDFLRLRLRRTEPDLISRVQRRAADELLRRGDHTGAVHHLLRGGDVDAARAVLGERISSSLSADLDGAAEVARRWLELHASDDLEAEPAGLLECTMALLVGGAVDEGELWLRRWQQREAHLDHTGRVLLHGALAFRDIFVGDPESAQREVDLAGELIAAGAVEARWADALLVLEVQSELWLGEVDEAVAAARAGLERPSLSPALALVRLPGMIAHAQFTTGEVLAAERSARAVLDAADRLGLSERHFGRADPELVLAQVAIERRSWAEAEERLERVMRVAELRRPPMEVLAHLRLAELADARGDADAGDRCIDRARAAQPRAGAAVRARIDAVELRRHLAHGRLIAAQRLHAALPPGLDREVLGARLSLAAGDHGCARSTLDGCRPSASTPRQRVDHGLASALAWSPVDKTVAADHLLAVLEVSAEVGMLQTILEGGPGLWDLLDVVPATGRVASLVEEVIDAAQREASRSRTARTDAPVDQLSERELTVLRYLASRLDSPAIASALFVSVNTVRTHVKAIYRKLGVSSRPDAVARARALGLL